jgi:hypothetical protein
VNGLAPEVITRLPDREALGTRRWQASCSEVRNMPGPYEVVIATILLFPWSLVLTAVIGTMWPKAKALARPRSHRSCCS